jgi:hypothetical protein
VEIAGYSGWGVAVIVGVLAFNLAMIPLWFLVGFLRRAHDLGIKELQTFLHLFDERADAEVPNDLAESVVFLRESLAAAEGLGPMWGRKKLSSAKLWMSQMAELHPEPVAPILDAMRR